MLSLDFIRTNIDAVKAACVNKNRPADVDKLLELDVEFRKHQVAEQTLRAERNSLAKNHTGESIARGKAIKDELKVVEESLAKLEEQIKAIQTRIPNVPLPEVPIGRDESENVEFKKVGEPRKFDFTPKDHLTLGRDLDIIDIERGSKVSGFRGYFLKNKGAQLQFALMFYVFNKLAAKGYTPILAPSIVKGFTLFGTGQFPWGEPEVYKLNDEDAYLAGTAEVPVTGYYSGEVLSEKDLPKKFVAFSPCFRREAGSHGKDTKGLYRVHEFWKIEQVILSEANLDRAREIHEELQANSEEILADLGLPYRVLLMCTGDMGEPQMKKYDTEVFMPSREAYGETMSNSIMGDFQTRRFNIRYKDAESKTQFCYSYNNTALAAPRILIACLENWQEKDGSISIPKCLQPLLGFDKIS